MLGKCKPTIMDAKSTIGMLVVNHPLYGICKNLHPIEDIKQCNGTCESSTYFDTSKYKLNLFDYTNTSARQFGWKTNQTLVIFFTKGMLYLV